jgi:hypothetical protein
MKKTNEIDYSKLLGFGTVGDLISGSVDFQDEMLGAKVCNDPLPNAPAEPSKE